MSRENGDSNFIYTCTLTCEFDTGRHRCFHWQKAIGCVSGIFIMRNVGVFCVCKRADCYEKSDELSHFCV